MAELINICTILTSSHRRGLSPGGGGKTMQTLNTLVRKGRVRDRDMLTGYIIHRVETRADEVMQLRGTM